MSISSKGILTRTFTPHEQYLLLVAEGEWDRAAVLELIKEIPVQAQQSDRTRILVDWRGVTYPEREIDRYVAGQEVAKHIRPPLKVAAIYHSEQINRFAENVAVNRGANLRIFGSETEALEWLLSDD